MSNESSKDQNVERRDFIKTLATVPVFGFFLVNLWLKLKKDGKSLKLTDPNMNRLIFTQDEAANLINRTIDFTRENGGGFIKSYKMKCVNMFDLAKVISDDIEIVGKRPGEKTDEDLISEREIAHTFIYGDDIHIRTDKNHKDNKLDRPYNSASAKKMTQQEMKDLVWG